MIEEKFDFSAAAKKKVFIYLGIGVLLTVIGMFMVMGGGHGAEHGEDAGHAFNWIQRVWVNLWINNVYFSGLAVIGVFFVAIQYVSQAGWSAGLIRIPMSFGVWLPIGGVLMLATFFVASHDIFHWTHHSLYEVGGAEFDSIINGKKAFFFWPMDDHPSFPIFYVARMVIFFAVWYLLFMAIRKESLKEDLEGGTDRWRKMFKLSATFLVFFAVSSSVAAWDWVMSIDTHWFSTMFGWYVFASWWVAGLALITYIVVLLRDNGYMSYVNSSVLHDLGKFVFAFSIFWTYIWFSQFLLIYYANIPEETIYFVERLASDKYAPVFFVNLLINFCFPFLVLMTRAAKRHESFLKIVCPIIIFGHWLDFYLMITPGTLQENGGFGLLEIGMLMIFASLFVFVALTNLAKAPLVAKNHPMLEESVHHNI